MTSQNEMPRRSIRVGEDLWVAAKKKATTASLNAIIRALLTAWVNDEIRVDATGKVTVGDPPVSKSVAKRLSIQEADDDA